MDSVIAEPPEEQTLLMGLLHREQQGFVSGQRRSLASLTEMRQKQAYQHFFDPSAVAIPPAHKIDPVSERFLVACGSNRIDHVVEYVRGTGVQSGDVQRSIMLAFGVRIATASGNAGIVLYLLLNGASVRMTEPAHVAQSGSEPVLQTLLYYGWDIDQQEGGDGAVLLQ